MGGTRAYYESLLMQKLQKLSEKRNTRIKFNAQGGLIYVSDQALEDALKMLKKDLDRQAPKKGQIGKAFRKFCDEQGHMERPRKLAHDDRSKKTFGAGDRFDQYKQNRDELLKACIQSVKKEIAWNRTTRDTNLKDATGKPVQLDKKRWQDFLIRTDGSAESKLRNEELYALMALGQKKITAEEFVQLRKKQYMNPIEGMMSEEDAEKTARRESERVGERILEMVKEEVERTKEDRKNLPSYTAMILNGKAGQKGYPSLEECHRVVDNNDLCLVWDLESLVGDLVSYGGLKNKDEARRFALDNQKEGAKAGVNTEMVELASNYYFAMIDPYKLIDAAEPMNLRSLPENLGTPDGIMRKAFTDACLTQYGHVKQSVTDAVNSFGLQNTDPTIIYSDKNPSMRVIRHEATDEQGNKSMRTAIMRLPRLTDVGGAIAVYANQPELLVNSGLEDSVKEFVDICKDWPRKRRSSPQFNAMRDALENLQNKKLLPNPSPDEIEAFRRDMQKLFDTSKDYYDYKVDERHGENFRRGFETTRVKFSKDLHAFAKQKLEELQYVKEHMDTLELASKEKKNLKNNKEYQAKLAAGYKGGPLGYLREKEEQRSFEQKQIRGAEKQRKHQAEIREVKRKEKEQEKKERGRLFLKVTDLKKGCTKLEKDHASAEAKITQYIEAVKAERSTLTNPEAKVSQAKHLGAARVIEYMLGVENKELKNNPQADATIHELVNGGKIKALTKLIQNGSVFQERFGGIQGEKEEQYGLVATDRSYLHYTSKSFFSDLKEAAEEYKEEHKNEREANRRSLVAGGFQGLQQEAGQVQKEGQIKRAVTFEKREVKNLLKK